MAVADPVENEVRGNHCVPQVELGGVIRAIYICFNSGSATVWYIELKRDTLYYTLTTRLELVDCEPLVSNWYNCNGMYIVEYLQHDG